MAAQTLKAPKLIARAQSAARSGDVEAAQALYREVLTRFPANRRAKDGLARLSASRSDAARKPGVDALLALWRAGRIVEALSLTDGLPIAHPTVRDIRAAALRKLGQPASAIPIYDAALRDDPGNAALWFNAGSARLEDHRLAEAQACLAQACAIAPEPAHLVALALCKLKQGHHREAETLASAVVERPESADTTRARAHEVRGTALMNLGRTAEALDCYGAAHSLAPEDPTILHNVGIAANATGNRDAAEQAFRAALAIAPDRAEIHRSLSGVLRYQADEPHLAQMRALLATGLPPAAEADLRFALFKAMDDLGRVADAAEHLVRANDLRRDVLRYDPKRDAALFARLATLALPELDNAPSQGPRPIFVVGLPRSGTTLTEQMLSNCHGTRAAGELPYAGQAAAAFLRTVGNGPASREHLAEFAASLRRDLAAHAGDNEVIIDKMPLDFRWAEILLAALPEARIVWLDRDPRENAVSLYRHCFAGSGNGFAYGMDDIARMIAVERDMRARVAGRWPDRVHVVSLERLTADPEPEIRALVDFCGLDWSEDCLSPHRRPRTILTASNQQIRNGITVPTTDGWTRFEPYLAPLSAALKEQGLTP